MRVGNQGDEVRLAMDGDRSAFTSLVRIHSASVHAYVARRAGSQVADELLSEVWLRAWRSRASYDLSWPSPRPWLLGIARNTLRAHWRARPIPAVLLPIPTGSDPWPEVDDRLDAGRARPAILAALGSLSEEQREVLLLVAWEEFSPTEVSVALGVPASTVRTWLHRARRGLQASLDQDLRSERPSAEEERL
jgi:RNA polymerase sigma factor (sigma-70 family)